MKIVILNGSPKGEASVTLQYIKYIQQQYPQHTYQIISVAQKIKQIEQDEQVFSQLIADIADADGVLWAFPLYYFLVPAQYKRFIELIHEKKVKDAFAGKHAAVLTTSIHFYDHTAHHYLRAICDDLAMNFVESYSAAMYDLTKETEQRRLTLFAAHFLQAAAQKTPSLRAFPPLPAAAPAYTPQSDAKPVSTQGKKVVVLTDCRDEHSSLHNMVSHFQASFVEPIAVYNLHDIPLQGGCLGCMHCAYDNTCVYRDGYKDFVLNNLSTADILVFAGTITDRYLSSAWKYFFDRSFFNNHVPLFKNKQIAAIISGPFSQLANLRQILEGYTEMQFSNLVGFVTDEHPAPQIDTALQTLATQLVDYSCQNYSKPFTFLHIGGKKIFRDELWSHMRFPFVADYKYYSKNDYFDFPYKKSEWLMNAILTFLTTIPGFRKEVYSSRMTQEMLKPFAKITKQK